MYPEEAAAAKPSAIQGFALPMKPGWVEIKQPNTSNIIYLHKATTAVVFTRHEMWAFLEKKKRLTHL